MRRYYRFHLICVIIENIGGLKAKDIGTGVLQAGYPGFAGISVSCLGPWPYTPAEIYLFGDNNFKK